MGERLSLFRPRFNRSLQIVSRPAEVSSDAGVVLLREVLEKLGLIEWLDGVLSDPRDPSRVEHSLSSLLRTRLLAMAMGWSNQDDVERLAGDPAVRLAVSDARGEGALNGTKLASQASMSRLLAILAIPDNLAQLNEALCVLAGRSLRASSHGRPVEVVLDLDSIVHEVHGHQDGSAYNGQYKVSAYHPIVAMLGETGDIVGVWLRPGNAHTAEHAPEFVLDVIARIEAQIGPVRAVRFDAGFPSEPLMAALEERGVPFVARIRKNAVLDKLAGWATLPMLPAPETTRTRFKSCGYKAGSWSRERRVVYVRIDEPGELFSRSFFLVSSIPDEALGPDELLGLYRRRGCAEDAFGQWLGAVPPTLCSTNRTKARYRGQAPKTRSEAVDPFANNEANLLLSALAANLLIALRRLVTAATGAPWRLARLREQVLKVGAVLVRGGRRLTLTVAESSVGLWGRIIAKIEVFQREAPRPRTT